jgi:hypothetical protein
VPVKSPVPQIQKVFCFFFSKKKRFLLRTTTIHQADADLIG